MSHRRTMIAVCLCLGVGLAGCGRPSPTGHSLSVLDNELVAAAAAGDSQAAHAPDGPADDRLRPRTTPDVHGCPSGGRSGDCMPAETVTAPNCSKAFVSGLKWATRLPAGIELYPGAKVIEAAGSDDGECHVRLVSYVSDAAPEAVIDWYRAAAGKAGYAPQIWRHGREHFLAGARTSQGDAVHITVAVDGENGSAVDLIVNHGR